MALSNELRGEPWVYDQIQAQQGVFKVDLNLVVGTRGRM